MVAIDALIQAQDPAITMRARAHMPRTRDDLPAHCIV